MIRQVRILVPATTANLGSGFDAVGLALDYCDELVFTRNGDDGCTGTATMGADEDGGFAGGKVRDVAGAAGAEDMSAHVIIHGEGEDTLPRDETHLVVSTFRRACRTFGLPLFGFTLEANNRIPQARGMGSSAEAIVAGIAAAAAFATADAGRGATGSQPVSLDRDSIFALAAQAEGHPDNVAPAVYGGLTASWRQEAVEGVGSFKVADAQPLQTGFHSVQYPVSGAVRATVFVPDFELSTERARRALPSKVPYDSAVYNVSRAALLPAAMNCGNRARGNQLLFAATQDSLHQPYRRSLMASAWALIERLRSQGFAAAVSGAGPCILVLHYGDVAEQLDTLAADWLQSGHWKVLHLAINASGIQVEAQ